MIEIKCSEETFERIINTLENSRNKDGLECVLGKVFATCNSVKDKANGCKECLKKNIKYVPIISKSKPLETITVRIETTTSKAIGGTK